MLYKHYKGGLYRTLVDVATFEATGEKAVVYVSVETGVVWIRNYYEFHGTVQIDEAEVPRFLEIDELNR